jgi:hypothetical protein
MFFMEAISGIENREKKYVVQTKRSSNDNKLLITILSLRMQTLLLHSIDVSWDKSQPFNVGYFLSKHKPSGYTANEKRNLMYVRIELNLIKNYNL